MRMQSVWRFLKNKENLTVIGTSIVLCGLIAFLLAMNYSSQLRLQKTALERLKYNVQKRAVAVSYFYSERKNDLNDLATSREISVYFENKALGMSMEYGLRASLLGISGSFEHLLGKSKLGKDHIYNRIVFVDSTGEALVDSQIKNVIEQHSHVWERFRTPDKSETFIITRHRGRMSEIMISTPYFFKDKYEGQIIAWISPETVYFHLVKSGYKSSKRMIAVDCGQGCLYPWTEIKFLSPFSHLPNFEGVKIGKPYQFKAICADGTREKMIALRVPVSDTPFSLVYVLSSGEVYGSMTPGILLLATGFSSLFILIVAAIIIRINTHKLVFSTRLEETAKRERDIEAKNLALKMEIIERERAEMELFKLKEVAEAANRAKSDFLANMSHELRTPLNAIIGFTELVVDKNFGNLNNVQEEYLNDVLQSSRHLLSLINDILDLSKIEAGKLELEPSSVNLEILLENSLIMVKEKAMKNGLKLSTKIKEVQDTIHADERKLKQVIYNLISNAIKFTPDGGSIIVSACSLNLPERRMSTQDGREITLPSPNDHEQTDTDFVEVSIKDTGIGISQENLDRIFKSFEQIDGSYSRKYQGTGLGLSLSRNLIELHGGRIWAESEGEGKGSTFRFVIPV